MSQPPGSNPDELLQYLDGIIAQCEAQQQLIEQTAAQVRQLELLLRKPAVTFSEPPTKE